MSVVPENCKCSGVPRYPFFATSLEPQKYDRVEYTYDGNNVTEKAYYMGSKLMFKHVLTYDAQNKLIKLEITC